MHLVHDAAAQNTMKSLFQGVENPFSTFRAVFEPMTTKHPAPIKISCGFTNQAFARKISGDRYAVSIGLVIGYQTSTHESAYVIMGGVYNAKTQRLTQVQAFHGRQYTRNGKELKLRRTGTVTEIYELIADQMSDILAAEQTAYWEGFRAHYGKKNMHPGYYLD